MALAAVLLPASLQAQLITFTFSGLGTGTVGTTAFTSAATTLSFTGNLANTTTGSLCGLPMDPTAQALGVTGGFGITGIGTGTFTNALNLVFLANPVAGTELLGVFQCSTPPRPVALMGGPVGSFGGIVSGISATPPQSITAGGATDAGILSFTRFSGLRITSGPAATVPEPSGYALIAAGLGALVVTGLRRRRAAISEAC